MRSWDVQEDLILLKSMEQGGIEQAYRELGRPIKTLEVRLAFLADHEIIAGPDGELAHQKKCTTDSIVSQPIPKLYESGYGKKLMEQTVSK